MPPAPPQTRINRATVLTLWATVVAERFGYPPETALTLGRFVAGSSARAKARRLGISDEKQEAEERHIRAAELRPRRQTVHLFGRDIPVLAADGGTLRAEDDGKPASAKSVQSYIARAFGDRLGEARAAMEALAASLPAEELNRVGSDSTSGFGRMCLMAWRARGSAKLWGDSPPHIGGATPSLPTITRLAVSLPSAFFVAPKKTGAPDFRSARSAGAKVTTGTDGGTKMVLLPSL
jgi:hypothetical protein